MNGELVSTGANYADSNILKPYFNKTSSFIVKSMIAKKGTDSVTVTINIKKVDTSSLTTAALFMGVLEDTVFVNGGNGELKHYNTLRKSTQQNINLPSSINDSLTFSYTTMIQSIWNIKRMFSIGILNHSTNKKLVQAGYSALLKDAILSSIDQVPLTIISEHFTNTKCSVCASRNPGFYTNYNSQSGILEIDSVNSDT